MAPDLSRRTKGLGTENAFEVLAEVNKLKREGKDVVSFCIGQPDFGTPENIRAAAIEAIKAGKSGYTDSAGILEARTAVADYLSRTRSIDVKPEDVVIANGAKPFIGYAVACATDPGVGDEVIYPNPGYPIYQSQIVAKGAVPISLPLSEEKKFSFDLDQLRSRISSHTRMLILNTPHNPTGGMLSRGDLEEIAILAKKHNFWIYADEVYSQIVYDGKFESIASIEGMYERTIVSDGASKTYAMPGWRMGYVANPVLAPHIARWVTNTESCANHMTQYAIVQALNGPQDAPRAMVAEFKRRRDVIVKRLNEMDGVNCQMPAGAFYVYPNVNGAVKKLGMKSAEELRARLLKAGVAVLADQHFGRREPGEQNHYLRLSYCTSMENIEAGLARMKEVLGAK
ncbi:Aromatic-amino-acid aminotransferase 2 [uncultured archaeon]|nr:Aromatic-amino-acid aminotransferase 2 [uncultured archaeon]